MKTENYTKEYIKFLGTSGGRFVTAKQLRSSAGTFIKIKNKNILFDPGPGSLVKCTESNPPIDVTKIDAVILSHAHIDHTNDANIIIDAMTYGGLKKRGLLFAPEECINGENAVILKYLRNFLDNIVILKPEQEYNIDNLSFSTSIKHQHQAETYGIMFNCCNNKKISFMVDTKYFPELAESYKNTSILIINVLRYMPYNKNEKVMHLSVEDAKQIIKKIKPEKTILTHFGMTMLKANPWETARKLTEETGLEVIAATDGMTIEINTEKNKK